MKRLRADRLFLQVRTSGAIRSGVSFSHVRFLVIPFWGGNALSIFRPSEVQLGRFWGEDIHIHIRSAQPFGVQVVGGHENSRRAVFKDIIHVRKVFETFAV